jgi:ABC-type phosphate/phosphonate transport system substrate-binding protein
VYADPARILDIFSPILRVLEEDLGNQFRRPVLINLKILQSYDRGYGDLETNATAFGRVGPASFVHLLDRGTGVRLVAMQDHKNPLTMALFTASTSTVAQISIQQPNISLQSLLANRSVAFGNSNSTTGSQVARWFMATNGVFATNLAYFRHLNSHAAVIDEVGKGKYDVGLVNQELINQASNLHVVKAHPVSEVLGRCWIASRNMDSNVFAALRASLLRMRDPAIIGKIESKLDGFKVVDDSELEGLRKIMSQAADFERRTTSP